MYSSACTLFLPALQFYVIIIKLQGNRFWTLKSEISAKVDPSCPLGTAASFSSCATVLSLLHHDLNRFEKWSVF